MKLNPIFTSNMVFAANHPIRIYGEGLGDAAVTFAGQTKTVSSDNGKWLVEFPAMEYSGPYDLSFISDGEEIILEDIFIGEVYLLAGQSNIQFKLKESSVDTCLYQTNENLRLFSTDRIEKTDYFTSKDGWVKCDKESAGEWSAIGYLVGNEISENKNIAVGVIACYQGASVIESWVPEGTFEKTGINIPLEEKHNDHRTKEFSEWNADGKLYSFALSQVIPFSLTGVIWYQGESDTSMAEALVYKEELSTMIDIWRKDFNDDTLPFVIIQIADYIPRVTDAWRKVQQAQEEIQNTLPNVKTVISADVCETDDIHPKTKDKLSKRIVEALNSFYRGNI